MAKEPTIGIRFLWGALIRIILSLPCAGIFYLVWMAVFLLATRLNSSAIEAILWLLAPVLTAAGFAIGITISEQLTQTSKTRFLGNFIWPLIGCAIGAGVVYWFGPMLIVFGMFVAGTISVAFREAVRLMSKRA